LPVHLIVVRLLAARHPQAGVDNHTHMPYYPCGAHFTAIDLTEGMLSRARKLPNSPGLYVDLCRMAVEALTVPSESFDTVVATFVFCSVLDPVSGLRQ
jgi:phosphatidylethanolamine/phosphatidyl-N-methylethanolamine N-methyltransferase